MTTTRASANRGVLVMVRRVTWRAWMITRVVARVVVVAPFAAIMTLFVAYLAIGVGGILVFYAGRAGGSAIELVAALVGADIHGKLQNIGGIVALVLVGLMVIGLGTLVIREMRREDHLSLFERVKISVTQPIANFRGEWATAGLGRRHPGEALPVGRSHHPISAWREWRLGAEPGTHEPVLGSVTVQEVWESQTLEASCVYGTEEGTEDHSRLPVLECTCGIYAHKNEGYQQYASGGGAAVRGRVDLHGRVLEGSHGYRAERATISGPVIVQLRCSLKGRDGRCRGEVKTGAARYDGFDTACETHASALREPRIDNLPLWLQSRLELRYGVDVQVTQRRRR